jgi:hypothetical protein
MARGVPDAGPPAALFLRANAARQLVGISVGIGSNRRGKLLQVQMVIGVGACRPGAPSFAAAQLRLAGQEGQPECDDLLLISIH